MHNLADVSEDQAPRFMAESAALDFVRPLNRPIRLVQPADDTLMANRVSHEPPGGPQPSTANVSRLFGRAHELAAIREHLQAAPRAGSLGLIGETGAGKTALIMSAQQLAIDSNMLVLSARGTPGERPIAFSGLHQLLVPLVGLSATLSPRLRVAIEAALGLEELSRHDPLVLLNAVIALLRSASDTQPLLLAVDDLDLIDDETTQVLASLAHRMPILSTALIWSAAPGKVAPGLNGETMVIGRLDHLDADALVRETAPRLTGYLRRIVIAEGAGNPLALKALARARDDSLAPRPCKVGMDALPAVALAPFIAALDRLTHQASQGLLLVALERRGAMPVLLRAGVGAEELEELDASRLCRIDTASLSIAFTHPLTRFVVTNRADIAQRRQGHLALAGVLSDTPEEQAFHLAEAAIDSDEATADLLESAGRAAAERGDTSAAVQALLRAAQLSPSRSRARRRRAESDFLAIQVVDDNARRQFADDLERLPRRGPGAMYAAVVLAYKRLGENISVVAACDLIRDAVLRERQSWSADNGELVNALTGWLNLLWVAGRDDRWEAFFEVLCKLEPAPPEPLATIAAVSADPAHTSPAQRERIVELLSNDGPWTLPATTAALCSDRLAPIIPASARQIETGRRSGHTRTSLGALVAVALQDFSAGRWDRALALADEAEAGLRGAPEDVISAMVTYLRALISVCRGDEARSSELLGQMVDISIRTGAVGIGRLERRVRALASCAKGAWEEAFRHAAALQAPGDFERFNPAALWVAFDLVEAAVRTNRIEDAERHAAAMQRLSLAEVSPRLALYTYAAQGLVARDEAADAHFEAALSVPGGHEFPFDVARVELTYGMRLRRDWRIADARAHLHAAFATFEQLDARPWADRARSELRAAHDPVERQADGQGTPLTPQERAIADLAAAGLSNKEIAERLFLSSRTVGGHLYRLFPKLGIVSRSALRDALSGLG